MRTDTEIRAEGFDTLINVDGSGLYWDLVDSAERLARADCVILLLH